MAQYVTYAKNQDDFSAYQAFTFTGKTGLDAALKYLRDNGCTKGMTEGLQKIVAQQMNIPDTIWASILQTMENGNDSNLESSQAQISMLSALKAAGLKYFLDGGAGEGLKNQFVDGYISLNLFREFNFEGLEKAEDALAQLSYYITGTNSEFIQASIGEDSSASNMVSEYRNYETILNTYGSKSVQGKEAAQKMKDLEEDLMAGGYGDFIKDPGGAIIGFALIDNPSFDILRIGGAQIIRGDVIISTGTLNGSGQVRVESGGSIEVVSNLSGMSIMAHDLTIQPIPGGRIMIAADQGSQIQIGQDAADDRLLISVNQAVAGNLLKVESLYNLLGKIEIISQGDLNVVGDVFARTITMTSMGRLSIIKKGEGSFHHIGGQPILVDSDGNLTSMTADKPGSGDDENQVGQVIALGDIYISADYINVNGLIQSGVKTARVTVNDSDLDSYQGPIANFLNKNGILEIGYSVVDGVLVFNSVYAGGGNIYLNGEVISTNKDTGRIEVYTNPDVTITNNTNSDIELGEISTGNGLGGNVFIKSKDQSWGDVKALDRANTVYKTGDPLKNNQSKVYFHTMAGKGVTTEYVYEYVTKKLFGLDFLYPDSSDWSLKKTKEPEFRQLTTTGGYFSEQSLSQIISALKLERITPEGATQSEEAVTGITQKTIDAKYGVSGTILEYNRKLSKDITITYTSKSKFLGIYKEYTYKKVEITGSQDVIWVIVDTNQDVALKNEQGGGTVTVINSKKGDIQLNGSINANGEVRIEANDGSIVDIGDSWINTGGGITLSAGGAQGHIGSFKVENGQRAGQSAIKVNTGGLVHAIASGNIYLDSAGVNLNLKASAGEYALISSYGGVKGGITAQDINVTAYDDVTLVLSEAVVDQGVIANVQILGFKGDIELESKNDLKIERLSTLNSVSVVTEASILDYNRAEEPDYADIDRLKDMWDRLKMAAESETQQVQMIEEHMAAQLSNLTATYHGYWRLKSYVDSHGSTSEIEAELAAMAARLEAFDASLTGAYLGEDHVIVYDPGNAQQREYLENLVNGTVRLRTELERKVVEALYGNTTTTLKTEEANIVANKVFLKAGKDIGTLDIGQDYVISDYNNKIKTFNGLSEQDKLMIWSSEATDRTIDADGNMTIRGNDDFNVLLTGQGGSLTFVAGGDALIGSGVDKLGFYSDQSLTVNAGVAGGELRVKADMYLYQGAEAYVDADTSTSYLGLYSGGYMVLESSNNDIGREGSPVFIGDHDWVFLRAHGHIYVQGLDGLNIDGINTDTGTLIESDEDIRFRREEDLIIKSGTIIHSQKNIYLEGRNITIESGSTLIYDYLEMYLNGRGDLTSTLVIEDNVIFNPGTGSFDPDAPSASLKTNLGFDLDYIDFSASNRDALWTFTGVNAGYYESGVLSFTFEGVEYFISGKGDDSVYVQKGAQVDDFNAGDGDVKLDTEKGSLVGDFKAGDGGDNEFNLGGEADNITVGDANTNQVNTGPGSKLDNFESGDSSRNEFNLGENSQTGKISTGNTDNDFNLGQNSSANQVKTGQGDDYIKTSDGSSVGQADLGQGHNVVDNSGLSKPTDWTVNSTNNNQTSSMTNPDGTSFGPTTGLSEIIGTRHGDSIQSTGPDYVYWVVDGPGGRGNINGLLFSGVTTIIHNSTGGGRLDLHDFINYIDVRQPGLDIFKYGKGYYNHITYVRGTTLTEMLPQHRALSPDLGSLFSRPLITSAADLLNLFGGFQEWHSYEYSAPSNYFLVSNFSWGAEELTAAAEIDPEGGEVEETDAPESGQADGGLDAVSEKEPTEQTNPSADSAGEAASNEEESGPEN